MGLLDPIFGGGTDTSQLTQGSAQSKKFLQGGKQAALNSYGKAQKKYTPQFEKAAAGFDPYNAMGQKLNSLYSDALGVNGDAGYGNAVNAYHHNLGWDSALNEANQNVMRNQAATGGLNSGWTLQALSDRAQGLQNQEYQSWLDNLYRGGSQGLLGAQGASSARQGLGAQFAATGAGRAGVQTGAAGALASNAYNTGLGLQNQTAADQASQLSLLNAILGGGAQAAGAYFGAKYGRI